MMEARIKKNKMFAKKKKKKKKLLIQEKIKKKNVKNILNQISSFKESITISQQSN